ncbi:glycosyltransferase family 2 protein [Desulfobacterium sp. N47]
MTVSVCIATYNGEKFIGEQLLSIIEQIPGDSEIIIVDDCSTDKTLFVIKQLRDYRIRIYYNPSRQGPVKTFERAIKLSRGDYIFLSDQDDVWVHSKIRLMKECLSHYDLVVSDAILIDDKGSIINDSFYKLRNSGPGLLKNLYKNTYLGCCMAFNRKILEKSLPFPAAVPMHDMWLGMIAELYGTAYFCNEKLIYYRRHPANTSPAGEKSSYSMYAKLKFRYNLLYELSKRYIQIHKV